jgi:predicted AAA+ superfamily ATPase
MFNREIAERVKEDLSDRRVVLITGPRQAGKSTLAQSLAAPTMVYRSLDDQVELAAARADPQGYVLGLDRAIIDEVQRVPELLLAIKLSVDRDPRPGRFLLTGSADVMMLPKVADSLAGRMSKALLLPLARSEMLGRRSTFLRCAFAGELPSVGEEEVDLLDLVFRGGYPEAQRLASWRRRTSWLQDYTAGVVERDARDVADVQRASQLMALLRLLAVQGAQTVNFSQLGMALAMSHATVMRYIDILAKMYLIELLPPWSNNRLSRLTKAPKIHFNDSALMASLAGLNPETVRQHRKDLGPCLETYVFGELKKMISWQEQPVCLYHFRDRDRHEVDFILQDRAGTIVAIEVKASHTVGTADFKVLTQLRDSFAEHFAFGIVIYQGPRIVPFGKKLFAVPLSCLSG